MNYSNYSPNEIKELIKDIINANDILIEKGFAFEEFVKTAQEKIDDLKKLEDSLKKDKLK